MSAGWEHATYIAESIDLAPPSTSASLCCTCGRQYDPETDLPLSICARCGHGMCRDWCVISTTRSPDGDLEHWCRCCVRSRLGRASTAEAEDTGDEPVRAQQANARDEQDASPGICHQCNRDIADLWQIQCERCTFSFCGACIRFCPVCQWTICVGCACGCEGTTDASTEQIRDPERQDCSAEVRPQTAPDDEQCVL